MYNFSHTTYGPVGEWLSLRRMLAADLVPDYLLVEVMSPFLAEDAISDWMIRPVQTGFADLRQLSKYRESPWPAWRAWAGERARGWSALRFLLLYHAGAEDWLPDLTPSYTWRGLRPGGWTPPVRETTPEHRAAQLEWTRGGYAQYFAGFRIHPLQDRIYRDLLHECRARGIRVAFFLMPESPTFRSWYPAGARAAVREYLNGLTREFGAPVFDASDWLPDEASFHDGHHLLGPGAEAFSARFGKDCLAPWLGVGVRSP